MNRIFLWAIGLACLLGATQIAAGPTDRLAETDPVSLGDIWVNGSVNPVTGGYCEIHQDLSSPGAQPLIATRRYGIAPKADDDCALDLGRGWAA